MVDSRACCYLLENSITGNQYVGITDNFERRKKEHSRGHNAPLKKDIKKYGWDSFTMKKLVIGSRKYCLEIENRLIQTYKCSIYNIAPGGTLCALPGEKHYNAKLTEEQVLKIREKYSNGYITQKELGAMYKVHEGTISQIVRGTTWSATEGPLSTNKKYNAKLTEDIVLKIRAVYNTKKYTTRAISKLFNISQAHVSDITSGKVWSSIGGSVVKKRTKLNNKQAKEIRELYMEGNDTLKSIGILYNVSYGTISNVIRGYSYTNAGGPIRGKDYD